MAQDADNSKSLYITSKDVYLSKQQTQSFWLAKERFDRLLKLSGGYPKEVLGLLKRELARRLGEKAMELVLDSSENGVT